jgi:hypothetical protein
MCKRPSVPGEMVRDADADGGCVCDGWMFVMCDVIVPGKQLIKFQP